MTGAITGALGSFVLLEIFTTLSGTRDVVGELPVLITIAIAAAVPALYLHWAERKHRDEALRLFNEEVVAAARSEARDARLRLT